MNKKKIVLLSIAIFVVIAIVAVSTILIINNKPYGLSEKGILYDNVTDFEVNADTEHTSSLSRAFLKEITYEIIEIDEDKMTATIIVSVPDISEKLPNVVDDAIIDNQNMEYDELLSSVKEKFQAALESDDLTKKETTIELSIKNADDGYKLVPNDKWNQVIYGDIENMYLEYLKTLIGGMTNENPQ